jgi:hypothetical protein
MWITSDKIIRTQYWISSVPLNEDYLRLRPQCLAGASIFPNISKDIPRITCGEMILACPHICRHVPYELPLLLHHEKKNWTLHISPAPTTTTI